jgi:hypothetical protein
MYKYDEWDKIGIFVGDQFLTVFRIERAPEYLADGEYIHISAWIPHGYSGTFITFTDLQLFNWLRN